MTSSKEKAAHAQDAFSHASALARAGDIAAAESVCRRGLEKLPDEANLLCLLGALLVRQRRADEAEAILPGVVARFPEFAKAHEELANAFLLQGKLEDASRCLQRTLELAPDNALAQYKLGKVLGALGRDGEAQTARAASSSLAPVQDELARAAWKRGAGQREEAEQIYRDLLARDPDNCEVYQSYGDLAMEQGQSSDAIVFYRRAVDISPQRADAWIRLGRALGARDQFDAAIEAARSARDLEPRASLPHLLIAGFLSRLGRYDEAIAAYESVLLIDPGNTGALNGLGHAHRTIGRHSDAVRLYRRSMRIAPGNGEAYWNLANLKNIGFEANEIQVMRDQLRGNDLAQDSRVHFCFALASAMEDAADFKQAFELYRQGNSARRQMESYDAVATQELCERIIDVFDRPFFEQRSGQGEPDSVPIFIVGLPRSGSTLIEQVLASHSKVRGTRELPYLKRIVNGIDRRAGDGPAYPESLRLLDAQEALQLGRQYLQAAQPLRAGAEYFTDKTPANFWSIGLLQMILPGARVINARRHPLDSCVGSYKQLFAGGNPYAYDLFELGDYYLQYQRLMDHWHRVLPGHVLDVHYEDVVNNPAKEIKRLLAHCNLEPEDACLNFHETKRAIESASSEQVRQPIYTTSVDNWRHYEADLGELIDILTPVLESLPSDRRPRMRPAPD